MSWNQNALGETNKTHHGFRKTYINIIQLFKTTPTRRAVPTFTVPLLNDSLLHATPSSRLLLSLLLWCLHTQGIFFLHCIEIQWNSLFSLAARFSQYLYREIWFCVKTNNRWWYRCIQIASVGDNQTIVYFTAQRCEFRLRPLIV